MLIPAHKREGDFRGIILRDEPIVEALALLGGHGAVRRSMLDEERRFVPVDIGDGIGEPHQVLVVEDRVAGVADVLGLGGTWQVMGLRVLRTDDPASLIILIHHEETDVPV